MARELRTDVLILGSGGAGLMAALHAYDRSQGRLRVTLVSKGLIGKSGCTRLVQGGYNAVLDPGDSLGLHFRDTLQGGGFLNDQELAWTLVENAPRVIHELEVYVGCFFDRRADGRIHQKPFAGQSFDRTVHRGDLTGIEIVGRLRDQMFARDIQLLEEHRVVDLLLTPGGDAVAGGLLLDLRSGEFVRAAARVTILCTGGGARMYTIAAPSLEKTGDGTAVAFRAGCQFMDMEMLQFHPTGILAGASRLTGMVLEEGLRGAGGILRNGRGERFMERYDPQRRERATRDVVSRAAYMEIMAGRGTPNDGVTLDVSHLGAQFVQRNFPGMVERCLDVGVDIRREPVEVSPTAHFHMGGVRIDTECRCNLPGLLVAGEDAGGVHGANRLGGNGVAESTVFGARAGDVVAAGLDGAPQRPYDERLAERCEAAALAPLSRSGGESPFGLRAELEAVMWEYVGVVRSGAGLRQGIARIEDLKRRLARCSVPGGRRLNLAWQEALNVSSMLVAAELTARSALQREESRGSHYRSDFPQSDDAWLCNVCAVRDGDGTRVTTRPVAFTRLDPRAAAVTGGGADG